MIRHYRPALMVVMFVVYSAMLSSAVAQEGDPKDRPLESGSTLIKPPAPAETITAPPAIDGMVQPGGFVSIQVNVDDNGMNIVGDAANEPSIAVDPTDPNRIAIGWRQFDTINSNFREAGWAYSQDAGATWTFPGVLENGIFRSDPVLAADRFGDMYYYSIHTNLADVWRCDMFTSSDGGVTWTGPIFGYGGDKAWFVIDNTGGMGDGHIYAAWNTAGNEYFPRTFTRSTDRGQNYSFPAEIPQRPKFGTLAVGPDGELYIIGVNGSGSFYVLRSDNAQNAAQTPDFDTVTFVSLGGSQRIFTGPNPDGLLGQAWVAVDHSGGPTHGNVYALCSVDPSGSDPLDIRFARSTNGGQSFGASLRLNDDATNGWQWFGTMAVAPNGRIDVIWNDTRNDPTTNFSELYYTYSSDGGQTWAANVAVSPPYNHFLGYPQQNKLGDYYDMISMNSGAHVAWAATFNGEQDVYYLFIPAPCLGDTDGSGAVDFADILAVLAAWGPCSGCPEDLDDSGTVDFADLLIVLANWGPC